MEVNTKHKYEQSVDKIYKSYTSKKFLKAKMEAIGSRNIEIEVEKGEDKVTVKIVREVPADVPGMLKKFVRPWNKMIQTETWEGSKGGPYNGVVKVVVVGAPVNMEGKMKLKETKSGGCSAKSTTVISCNVPFVGKKLTKFIAESSEESINDEAAYISENV